MKILFDNIWVATDNKEFWEIHVYDTILWYSYLMFFKVYPTTYVCNGSPYVHFSLKHTRPTGHKTSRSEIDANFYLLKNNGGTAIVDGSKTNLLIRKLRKIRMDQ